MNYLRLSAAVALVTLSGSALAGPDLICSEINSSANFGFANGKVAYSFGTTLCNIGDSELAWDANTNQHPLISQTLYRLKDHQITQIGIGFVRHTTIPLAGNACGLGCTPAGFTALGAGCSDMSSGPINGSQGLMGPRSEVDPFASDYPYPFTSINQTGDAIYKRLQVDLADVSDPDALYFVETQVIAPGEATGAQGNNVSYRQVTFTPGSASAILVGPTYSEQPAIFAWRDHGNGIGMPDTQVLISQGMIPDDGIIHVGSRATDLGGGNWRYDYAIHNQNASQSVVYIAHSTGNYGDANSFEFQSVAYHDDVDGLIDNSDWNIELINCFSHGTWYADGFPDNPLSNAIRWGTTYSFSFQTMSEPFKNQTFGMEVGYNFASNAMGKPYFFFADAISPNGSGICICAPDINRDGNLNFFDVSAFLGNFNKGADYNGDGSNNFFDVSAFLADFAAGCP